jgi:hypothetical protein
LDREATKRREDHEPTRIVHFVLRVFATLRAFVIQCTWSSVPAVANHLDVDNAALLRSMLITQVQLSAMSRVHMPESERHDFFLYVDEFQNFATESFVKFLSEAKKYRLKLT